MAGKEGDKDKKGNEDLDLSKNPTIVAMEKTLAGLASLITQQGQSQAKTNKSLDSLVTSIREGKLGGPSKKKEEDIDPDAINDLENSQLVPLIMDEIGKLIDGKLGDVGKRIDNTDKDIADGKVAAQVKALVGTNPDLFEWSDEIKEMATKNPNLTIKQAYNLAQEENPTKVAEMAEKYKDKDGEKEKDKPGLIGLMPTSGAMAAEDDEKLTKDEAAEAAWEDTLENFPAIAQLGEG